MVRDCFYFFQDTVRYVPDFLCGLHREADKEIRIPCGPTQVLQEPIRQEPPRFPEFLYLHGQLDLIQDLMKSSLYFKSPDGCAEGAIMLTEISNVHIICIVCNRTDMCYHPGSVSMKIDEKSVADSSEDVQPHELKA